MFKQLSCMPPGKVEPKMYCSNCGKTLKEGMKYCPECGAAVRERKRRGSARGESRANKQSKCPNCGELLDAFDVVCPACGYELRDVEATSSVKDFSERLSQLQKQSPKDETTKSGIFGKAARKVKGSVASALGDDTDDQIVSLIRSYPIPNTKVDLLEFVIMAASNIDVNAFNEMKNDDLSKSEQAQSRAWLSKLEQAYQKASISLADDEDFPAVQALYEKTMKRVKWAEGGMTRFWIALIGAWVCLMAFCLLMSKCSG